MRRVGSGTPTIRRTTAGLTTTERGYGWQWQKLRKVILAKEPLCRLCKEQGRYTPAAEVDHIDGNSHNNDQDNLRPLCRLCHLRRTAADQAFGKAQWRPAWLKPSTVPLVIVCGAPASGKSTWVAERAGKSDLVIDLDAIACGLAGERPNHGWDREKYLTPAIRARNEMLGDLGRTCSWPRAWLIASEARLEHRQWWADTMQPERIVVMETPPAICMGRARTDPGRRIDRTIDAIGRWWSRYERRDGDEVVRPT